MPPRHAGRPQRSARLGQRSDTLGHRAVHRGSASSRDRASRSAGRAMDLHREIGRGVQLAVALPVSGSSRTVAARAASTHTKSGITPVSRANRTPARPGANHEYRPIPLAECECDLVKRGLVIRVRGGCHVQLSVDDLIALTIPGSLQIMTVNFSSSVAVHASAVAPCTPRSVYDATLPPIAPAAGLVERGGDGDGTARTNSGSSPAARPARHLLLGRAGLEAVGGVEHSRQQHEYRRRC